MNAWDIIRLSVFVVMPRSLRVCFQSTKAKQKVTDQKLQQTEEAFAHAKQLYDEITDELYEELPAFYDRYGSSKHA